MPTRSGEEQRFVSSGDKFEWEQVLETLETEAEDPRPVSDQ